MEFFALPDKFVRQVSAVADCYERDVGFRPPDIIFICAAIDLMYDGVVSSTEGGDE